MADESKKPVIEDRPDFLKSIEHRLKDPEAKCLYLTGKRLTILEAKAICQHLQLSPITELNLSCNDLHEAVQDLIKVLGKTKVKKLDLSNCRLSEVQIGNLMTALSSSDVIDLDVSSNDCAIDEKIVTQFVPLKCSLIHLKLNEIVFCNEKVALHFLDALLSSSLTHLSLNSSISASKTPNVITKLFQILPNTAIKHLSLAKSEICSTHLMQLGDCFQKSAVKELDLSHNCMFDEGVDLLFAALVGSKLSKLNLSNCKIAGANNLGESLKNTQLTILDLSCNKIKHRKMFSFPTFLRGSSVLKISFENCKLSNDIGKQLMKSLRLCKLTELNVKGNNFKLGTFAEFITIVDKTEVTNINFGGNEIPCSSIIALGECLKRSKLEKMNFSNSLPTKQLSQAFAKLIEKTKGTALTSINLSFNEMNANDIKVIAPTLPNTTLTHLNLMSNVIGEGITSLTSNLNSTNITHLNLSNNGIDDKGAQIVAKCLLVSQIIDLELDCNGITCSGAKSLGSSFKTSKLMRISLRDNKIGNEGIASLAKNAENTLITCIEMTGNPGDKVYLIEDALWQAQKTAKQLVDFFNKIAPANDNIFLLESNFDDSNVEAFLEKCLSFNQTFIKQRQAADILAEDENINFSRSQILTLMSDEFPKQICTVIRSKFEANIILHGKFVRRAQELGLEKVVELLLQNQLAGLAIEEKKKEKKTKACGLCGKTKHLMRTPCCNNWICDDQHKYVMFSYKRNSCQRNHERYTLCAHHHNEKHRGDWVTCFRCKTDLDAQWYAEYTRHDYNFIKLENAPKSSVMGAVKKGGFQTIFLG